MSIAAYNRGSRLVAREADERVEAWIHRAGVKVVDVERDLGLRESKIYRFFRGAEHFRAAWLELLPPNVELLYLAERAAHHGRELVHVGDENRGSTFVELVHELSDVTRAASESERDGEVSPDEALAELKEIDEAERVLADRKAFLRRVVRERGATTKARTR